MDDDLNTVFKLGPDHTSTKNNSEDSDQFEPIAPWIPPAR